jgi:HEAT repeat protein
MEQTARAGSGNASKKGQSRMGMKGLMGAVALCALIVWAGVAIRDHLAGYQPLRAIRSGNVIERRAAAQFLSDPGREIDSEEKMAVLIPTLGDKDVGVRAAAAESLGSVVYQLRDHPATAPVASDLLKTRIGVATRGLVALLSDRDPGVRAAAATGLERMARRPPSPGPPTPEQLAALKDKSNAVRRRTAKLIYGSPDVTLPPELVAALEDESAEVRAAAARALVRFGPDLDPELPALFAMMERDETDVRRACSQAIQEGWPTPALVPTLVELLKSRDDMVRANAVLLLGRIGPEASRTIPALIAILNERFDLEQRDGSGAETSPGFPAGRAARALGQIGPSREGIAALVDVISPESLERVRAYERRRAEQDKQAQAVPAQGKIAPGIGPDPVLSGEFFRIAVAVQALGEIGPPAVAAIPALISAFNNGWWLAPKGIPAALGQIAPNSPAAPDAVAVLILALDEQSPSKRQEAIEALGHFGTDAAAAVPKLQALQADRDASIRDAAAKSLAALEAPSQPDAGGHPGRPRP